MDHINFSMCYSANSALTQICQQNIRSGHLIFIMCHSLKTNDHCIHDDIVNIIEQLKPETIIFFVSFFLKKKGEPQKRDSKNTLYKV